MRRPFWFSLFFALCLLGAWPAAAQSRNTVVDIGDIKLAKEISPFVSTVYVDKDEDPVHNYPAYFFEPGTIFKGSVPDQYVTQKALVKFWICNNDDTARSVYFFPGYYFTSIRFYRVAPLRLEPLPDVRPPHREKEGYRLLQLQAGDSMQVVAELVLLKTYINKLRPRLVNPDYLDAFISGIHERNFFSHLFTYIFCGLLLMMILFSLSIFLQGGNKEFLYYSGFAFFIGFMLFTKAFFNYRTESTSFFLESYLDYILQCTGIIFYMLFMQRFLGTKKEHPFLHKLYIAGIIVLILSIAAFSFLHYATDLYALQNWVENGTKGFLLLMIIIFLAYSLKHWKNKLFRYLFWGNLLYLLFSLTSLVLILAPGALPFKRFAGDALVHYQLGLFFELVLFLAGLNYKNRRRIIEETKEREALKAQTLVQEYEKELAVYKAQQEERQRISADMHDELGSGMTAIRLMSEIARNKMKENTPVEVEKISRSADDVLNKMNAIIWSMNSSNDTLDNLVSYIRAWSLEYFESTPVLCKVNTPDSIPRQELTGDKRRNIFLCVKESLNNVLKHAGASAVTIDISATDQLVIRITDNGKGIDLEKLRQFGNGLKNINRRMEGIGGSFTIENNMGTVTTLVLPL